MKTLSGIFTFKLAVVIAVMAVGVLTVRVFAQGAAPRPVPAEKALTLKFKDAQLKDETENSFKAAMATLKGDQFSVRMTHKDGKVEEVMPSAGASIKVDKVIKSELVKSSDGEFTPIGMHVTQTVTSDSAAEIKSVLDTLK